MKHEGIWREIERWHRARRPGDVPAAAAAVDAAIDAAIAAANPEEQHASVEGNGNEAVAFRR